MFGRLSLGCSGLVIPVLALAAFASSFPAQLAGSGTFSKERTLTAQSFVTERLAIWQKKLQLEQWSLRIIMARSTDLKPRTLGNIHWDSDKKTAVIRVLDPADYRLPEKEMLADMEFTVVHELIHLKLSPLLSSVPRNEASRREEEHTVNELSSALLDLAK